MFSSYGWNPGNKFLQHLGTVIASKTNNPDITFAEVMIENNDGLTVIKMNIFIIYRDTLLTSKICISYFDHTF